MASAVAATRWQGITGARLQVSLKILRIEFHSESRELVVPCEVVAAWDSFKRYFAPRTAAADGVSSGGEESGDSDSESGNETPKGPFTYLTSIRHCTADSVTIICYLST